MKLIAVASRSFSKHTQLRSEILSTYHNARFNDGEPSSGDKLVESIHGSDGVITALEVIDENLLSRLPDLKVIGMYGVGLDNAVDPMHFI